MDVMIEVIGLTAGVLTTTAFIAQVMKIYRTKSGEDISARMIILFSAGIVLWLVYGVLLRSLPLILSGIIYLTPSPSRDRLRGYGEPRPAFLRFRP